MDLDEAHQVYSVASSPRGCALIINIEKFENGAQGTRSGSGRDYAMLKEMWEYFGYRVVERNDLGLKDFKMVVSQFTGMPELETVDSVVVFIMSHGKEDSANPHAVLISTSDGKFISSDWIKNRFSAINCRALINKPKMLFFEACRGNREDHGVPYVKLNSGLTLLENKLVPVFSDLLIVYPTLPGYVSQGVKGLGSLFVRECITVFKEDSPHSDLLTMLSKVYSVASSPRGYALIINIEKFENGTQRTRSGSGRDYAMLKEMWEYFGYRVVERNDLGLKDFEMVVSQFTGMPELKTVDSVVVFIMSHGKEDSANPHAVLISTSDGKFISSDWIKNRFSAINCRALINKPKMLFFQSCRGNREDHGVPYEKLNSGLTLLENKLVPVFSDLLIVYPTLPGYISQRDTLLGALFVQECITVFKEDSPHSDLLTMLSKVDYRIRRISEDKRALFQVVYYESWGFNKKMFFQPIKKDNRKDDFQL